MMGIIGKLIHYCYWSLRLKKKGKMALLSPGVTVTIPGNVMIGDRSRIYHQSFLALGRNGRIHIGKDSHLGVRCYCNVSDGTLTIGDNVAIGPCTQIYTYSNRYVPGKIYSREHEVADVTIGNNVFIGAGVIILPGVSIGDNAVIGAGAVVTESIPASVVAVGQPCRVRKQL